MSIKELFNWDQALGWDEFWAHGERGAGEELEFYELMTKMVLENASTEGLLVDDEVVIIEN